VKKLPLAPITSPTRGIGPDNNLILIKEAGIGSYKTKDRIYDFERRAGDLLIIVYRMGLEGKQSEFGLLLNKIPVYCQMYGNFWALPL
jgi:hypothetical protein